MEDAAGRKARLKALREVASSAGFATDDQHAQPDGTQDQEPSSPGHQADDNDEPVLKFRNYAPRDENIAHTKVAPAGVPDFEEIYVDPNAAIGGADPEDILVNVAPKKANWDLRRDIADKLTKLERKTQAAMIKLMHQEEQRRAADEDNE